MDRPRVLRFAVSSLLVTGGLGLVGATAGCKPRGTNTGPMVAPHSPDSTPAEPTSTDEPDAETPEEPAADDSVPAPLPPEAPTRS